MKKLLLLFLFIVNVFAVEKMDKLIIAGPVATVSHPFFKMIQSGALADVASKVEFRLWKNPDELRAILLKKRLISLLFPQMLLQIYTIKKRI